jgi:UPF0042 nucleotide-binding protein
MRVVVITGMSGAGRRSAAHAMEDLNWYLVDNVPPAMLPNLASYLHSEGTDRLAVVLDVRSRGDLEQIPELFAQMTDFAEDPHILFLEASDDVIVRRQESSRRPVPLQGSGTLVEGIQAERRMMSTLRAAADLVIDTTELNVHQLQDRIIAAYGDGHARDLTVTVVSFGFKHGIPVDADMVFDVRFLPNPHWIPELRPQTGMSRAVSDYVLSQPSAQAFLDGVDSLLEIVSAGYMTEGKRLVEVGVGCTGGKHRSVAMAIALGERLRRQGVRVSVLHRDLGRE